MSRYLLTHSLLSSWLYTMKDNPYSDSTNERDPMEDFLRVLRREPTETTEAMQKGIDFEDLVTDITHGKGDTDSPWYAAAEQVASIVGGGVLQYRAAKEVEIRGLKILLYGRLDCLKAGRIIDIKYTGNYDQGKFYDSTQHPMYLELIPEATEFTYVVSNGNAVWHETYRRDETSPISPVISDFLEWLEVQGLMEEYKTHWLAL